MSKISILFLIYLFISNSFTAQDNNKTIFQEFDSFYKKYVSSGLVDYKLLKANSSELDSLVNLVEAYLPSNDQDKKAFLINVYNICTIKQLTEGYPTASPLEISGFFDNKIVQVLGGKYSLNHIENKELRKVFNDPRLHFVLVCGAIGCPPIINSAYIPEDLEAQLDRQTKLALNNNAFIKVESGKALLSEIFKWYEEDFVQGQNVIEFINQYREGKIPSNYSFDYYPYDWRINEYSPENVLPVQSDMLPVDPGNKTKSTQEYTPSVLYNKGQWEFKMFNNLYTQTKGFDSDGNKTDFGSRSNFLTSINQFLFGVNSSINVGADIWINSVRINDSTQDSPFNILKFEQSPNTRTTVGYVGPKIKLIPFKKLSQLSFQTTFLIPTSSDMEGNMNGRPFLARDSYISITQIFYDYSISNKFQLFFQVSPWIYIDKDKPEENNSRVSVASPASIFLSYFPTQRYTVFVQQEFWPNYGGTGITSWFRQEGVGMKVQIIEGILEAEASYTRFSHGRNSGAGQTFNFGLRLIQL